MTELNHRNVKNRYLWFIVIALLVSFVVWPSIGKLDFIHQFPSHEI